MMSSALVLITLSFKNNFFSLTFIFFFALSQSNEWLKSKKENSIDVFGRSNARNNVRGMCLEVEIYELRSI